MRAMLHSSHRAWRGDQAASPVKDKNIVRIEYGIEHVAGRKFVHTMQHRDPTGGVAAKMDEAFRTGDFSHCHGGVEGVAAGNSVRELKLVGTKADPIGPIANAGI